MVHKGGEVKPHTYLYEYGLQLNAKSIKNQNNVTYYKQNNNKQPKYKYYIYTKAKHIY